MPSSLVRGRYVVCGVIDKDSSRIIEDGAVFQRDGEIIDVGPYSDLSSRHSPDEEIGSSDFLVIPGLVNAHHHDGLTPFQLGSLDYPLETWIQSMTVSRDVDPYLDTLYCAIQMIESGITSVMHNHGLYDLPADAGLYEASSRVVQAYEDSGMRVAFSVLHGNQNQTVFDDEDEFQAFLPAELAKERNEVPARQVSLEDYLSLCAELFARKRSDRTRIFISPHNVHTCSDTMLREIKDFRHAPLHRHPYPSARDRLPEDVRHPPLGQVASGPPLRPWLPRTGGLLRSRGVADRL